MAKRWPLADSVGKGAGRGGGDRATGGSGVGISGTEASQQATLCILQGPQGKSGP